MPNFVSLLTDPDIASAASVIGLLISIIGFAITILGVIRSKNAAERAEEAANSARAGVFRMETIDQFSTAITVMEEIKRLQRAGTWSVLPDRYAALRKLLVSIRSANPHLSDAEQSSIQGAIQHFSEIEQKVEKAVLSDSAPPNVAKLNQIVSSQVDTLHELLVSIKHSPTR